MSTTKQQLVGHLVDVLDRMYLQMRLGSIDDWPQAELTMPQLRTLMLLYIEAPLRMTELASALHVGLPSATSMVDRLVEKRLVERAPDLEDRRVVTCHLTEMGRQEAEKLWRLRRASINQIMQALSAEELETLLKALRILVRAVEGRIKARSPHEQRLEATR
ncbi:MAG: MarR family winged helix-turn-helix transcriptional regulator [Dehalococcoidia bacterium]